MQVKGKRKPLFFTLEILGVLFLSVLAGFSVYSVVFHSIYDDFYVCGMSMYPCFNSYASTNAHSTGRFYYQNGNQLCFDSSLHEGDIVDYGVMKKSDSYQRFDIVASYFDHDYSSNGLKSDAYLKIKRIIGLPNETITLEADGTPMGKLIVDKEVVEQPNNNFEYYNSPLKEAGISIDYPASNQDNNQRNFLTVTLKDDEYFLVGDNRYGNNSSDSRSQLYEDGYRPSPVKSNYIQGKIDYIIGKGEISKDGNSCSFLFSSYLWPWGYQKC